MPSNQLTIVFFITCAVYLLSLFFSAYFMQFAVKALPIAVLLVIGFTQLTGKLRNFVVVALVASGAGDIFLAIDITNSFVFGLSSFLIAQLLYSVTFVSVRDRFTQHKSRKFAAFIIVLFALGMAFYILPSTNELLIPVAIYLTVITCMGVSALLTDMDKLTVIGALSFICSDAILAQSIFKMPLPASNFLVMVTYYAAQYFILAGLIKLQHSREH